MLQKIHNNAAQWLYQNKLNKYLKGKLIQKRTYWYSGLVHTPTSIFEVSLSISLIMAAKIIICCSVRPFLTYREINELLEHKKCLLRKTKIFVANDIYPCASPFSGTKERDRSTWVDLASTFSEVEDDFVAVVSGGAKVSSNHCPRIGSLSSSKKMCYVEILWTCRLHFALVLYFLRDDVSVVTYSLLHYCPDNSGSH